MRYKYDGDYISSDSGKNHSDWLMISPDHQVISQPIRNHQHHLCPEFGLLAVFEPFAPLVLLLCLDLSKVVYKVTLLYSFSLSFLMLDFLVIWLHSLV